MPWGSKESRRRELTKCPKIRGGEEGRKKNEKLLPRWVSGITGKQRGRSNNPKKVNYRQDMWSAKDLDKNKTGNLASTTAEGGGGTRRNLVLRESWGGKSGL